MPSPDYLMQKSIRHSLDQDEDASDFAILLRECRMAAHVTQSELARRIGVDHSFVSRLESDARQPSRATVWDIAWALGMDDAARDELLSAAGFAREGRRNLFYDYPILHEVYDALQRNLASQERLEQEIRQVIHER